MWTTVNFLSCKTCSSGMVSLLIQIRGMTYVGQLIHSGMLYSRYHRICNNKLWKKKEPEAPKRGDEITVQYSTCTLPERKHRWNYAKISLYTGRANRCSRATRLPFALTLQLFWRQLNVASGPVLVFSIDM